MVFSPRSYWFLHSRIIRTIRPVERTQYFLLYSTHERVQRQKILYVYILTSDNNILYVGMTGNLEGRMYQHQFGLIEGFTKRYNIHHLIYYEEFDDVYDAINREKQIKRWSRKKKLNLIRMVNPKFEKLNAGWFDEFENPTDSK